MSKLTMRLLGSPQIELDGQPVQLGRHKATAMLAYLAMDKQRRSRDALAAMFWPDLDQSRARAEVRRTLSLINRTLGSEWLDIDRDSAGWAASDDRPAVAHVWLDVDVLREQLAACASHEHPADDLCPECLPLLTRAIELYRDGFLAGFTLPDAPAFDEWQFFETESLRDALANALQRLAQWHASYDEYVAAIPYARRWLALDPTQERAQRALMRLYAQAGQHAAALRQYAECERVLAEELGIAPAKETTQLYQAIQERRALPAPLPPSVEPQTEPAQPEENAPAPGEPPFKGLTFFDVDDANLFFGREALTSQLVQRLDRGERFLAVVGPSGSGKSSLARAGLLAALAGGDDPADSDRYLIHVLTPTAHPLETLALVLTHDTASVSETTTLIDDLARDPRSLHLCLRKRLQPHPDRQMLFLVDQFEELFTLCRGAAERQAFVDNLLTAATEPTAQAIIVITLRADFYHHCAQFEQLRQALEQHQAYIGAMTAEELRRAIEVPAEQGGWTFDPGLVELILRDVGADGLHPPEPESLPLLSHALLETWKRRQGHTLTLSGYADIGGVHGAIARTAEAVYRDLSPEQQGIARNVFLRLTELGQGTQDTRRRARLGELVAGGQDTETTHAIVQILAGARLITTDQDSVQVAHEALIREWPRLHDWLDESRADLRMQRLLAEAAQEWNNAARDASFLLHGTRLTQFEGWAEESTVALTRDEDTFLKASVAGRDQREAQEAERQRRELEQAQALAEAQAMRAEEQARSASQLRRRAVYMAVALLVALVAAVAAGLLGSRARTQADANALLAAQNINVANTAQADRAAALAGEATAQAASTRVVIELGHAQTAEALEAAQRATAQAAGAMEAAQRATAQAASEREAAQRATAEAARDEAQLQARWALASQLAAQAPTNLDDELDLALLLAVQAYNTADLPQSRGAMLEALEAYPGLVRILTDHVADITSVAFSPDGQWLASADLENTIHLWHVGDDWRLERTFQLEVDYTQFNQLVKGLIHDVMAFSPDGTLLAFGDWTRNVDPPLWVLDVASGEIVHTLTGHTFFFRTVAFSPDGTILASGSREGTQLMLWDVKTGAPLIPPLDVYKWGVDRLAFQPDGQALVTAGCLDMRSPGWQCYQSETHLWNLGTLLARDQGQALTASAVISQPIPGFAAGVASIAFNPDGSLLAMTGCNERQTDGLCRERGIALYDMALGVVTNKVAIGQEYQYPDQSVVFSPDGTMLVTHGRTGEMIAFWDVETLEPIRSIPAFDIAKTMAFDPTGAWLAVGAEDGNVYLWDTAAVLQSRPTGKGGTSALFATYDHTANNSSLTSAEFSPDGRILAAGGFDGGVGLWDVASGEPLRPPLVLTGTNPFAYGAPIWEVHFHPDGQTLATVGWDGTVRWWETRTWELAHGPLTGHPEGILGAAWHPDGTSFFAGCVWNTLLRWDMGTGTPISVTLAKTPDQISSVAINPDGTILASGCRDRTIWLWDPATGEPSGEPLVGHTLGVTSVAFSPDGKLLASSSHDSTIRLWDVETRQPIGGPLTGHQSVIWTATFSPDGQILASVDTKGMLCYWDVATQRPIGKPIQAHMVTMDAAYSPDGTILATVGAEPGGVGHIRFWDPDPVSWRARICKMVGRNLTQSEWARYLPDTLYEKTCEQWPAGE